jgi:hypothetical protein
MKITRSAVLFRLSAGSITSDWVESFDAAITLKKKGKWPAETKIQRLDTTETLTEVLELPAEPATAVVVGESRG